MGTKSAIRILLRTIHSWRMKMSKKNRMRSLLLVMALLLSVFSGVFQVSAKNKPNPNAGNGNKWEEKSHPGKGKGLLETINIVAINDFHGNVIESGSNPGIAKVAGAINELREDNPTFFFSAGDNFQGSAISNLTHGAVVNEAFKEMDLMASAIGNHEYDWGADLMSEWSGEGGYPFLASNIVYKDSREPVDYADPYMIQTVTLKLGVEVKIGYIGIATPETAYKTAAANVADIEFTDPVDAANYWSNYLREEMDVDAVVALTHLGGFQRDGVITGEVYDFAMGTEGIDLILSGHTHQTIDGMVNGVQILQGWYAGRALQVGQLSFNKHDGRLVNVDGYVKILNNKDVYVPPVDPAVAQIVADYQEALEPILGEVIGYNANELTHSTDDGLTPLGQWTAKALTKLGKTEIGLINGGGIREPLPDGDITMGTMYSIFPFDNTLVTMEVTGELLYSLIEHLIVSGNARAGQYYGVKAVFDTSLPAGSRITSLTLLDGSPVIETNTYTLSTLDFIYTGGDQYNFTGATNVVDTFMPVRDLLVDYIEDLGTIDYTYDSTAYVAE